MPLLEIRDLACHYGAIPALKGVSLDVNEGETVCMIGANGAGKSSTLMSISGVNRRISGAIRFNGQNILGLPAAAITRLGIIQVPEGRRIFPRLSVKENLELGAYTRRNSAEVKADLDHALGLFPRLKERLKQKGGTLSGGEQQMLAIARGLMGRPKLMLFDEPSLGLSPILMDEIFNLILRINKEGAAILLVEQNAHRALEISSRGYVLEVGRILFGGPSKDLLNDPRVKKAYLGEE